MIPRKLVLRNFMCYREPLPALEFDGIPIICLSGENGAGKSALLDALTWALWGEARVKSDDDLIALGAQEMEVELIFSLDGQDYRVIRKRSKGKRGQSWLDFQVRHNGGWKALSGATLRETQHLITDTLRMDYEIFINSAYLRQGHADEFTRKEPGRRKQVLADILGLGIYETLEGAAKERAKSLDGQSKVIDGQIGELRRQVEKRDMHAQLVAEAQERVTQLGQVCAAAEAAYNALSERVQALEARRARRDELRERLRDLCAENDELAREVCALREALSAAGQTLARREEILAGCAELRGAQVEQERLEGLQGSYEQLQARQRDYSDAIREAERRLRADLRVAEGELKSLQQRAKRRSALEAELNKLAEQLERSMSVSEELHMIRSRRSDLHERSRAVNELQLRRKDLQNQIDLKHDSLVGTREELKRRIKEVTERLKEEPRWRIDLQQALEERTDLECNRIKIEELRTAERIASEQVGALRAECEAIKARGEEINKKLALLGADGQVCPLCGSELGRAGIVRIEEEYERERKELRATYSSAKRQADEIELQLTELRNEILSLERRSIALTDVVARIARLERDLHEAEELRRRQIEDQRALDDVMLQLVKGDYERGTRAELVRIDAEIAALGNPVVLEREMGRIETQVGSLESQLSEQAQIRARCEGIQRDLQALDAELPALHELEEHINEMITTIEMGDYAHEERIALARVEAEIAALGYTADGYQAARLRVRQLMHWIDEERQLQQAEERMAHDSRNLARAEDLLRRRNAELEAVEAQLLALDEELSELGPALRERDAHAATLQLRRRELSVAERDLGEKQALLQRAEDAAAELLECEAQREALLERKSLFDELSLAFGKKGVQAMLIETAIPEIEREANALLARMTDNQMHLTFETQRDTKKGDIAETLEIKIADGLGTRDYDAFSGGEAFRLNFAIRIALAKLLAKRAGARLETLVIDEGFGTQDTRGRERLVEAITSVQSEFKQILVITHIQELKDMFPIQLEISKTPRGSVWALS